MTLLGLDAITVYDYMLLRMEWNVGLWLFFK